MISHPTTSWVWHTQRTHLKACQEEDVQSMSTVERARRIRVTTATCAIWQKLWDQYRYMEWALATRYIPQMLCIPRGFLRNRYMERPVYAPVYADIYSTRPGRLLDDYSIKEENLGSLRRRYVNPGISKDVFSEFSPCRKPWNIGHGEARTRFRLSSIYLVAYFATSRVLVKWKRLFASKVPKGRTDISFCRAVTTLTFKCQHWERFGKNNILQFAHTLLSDVTTVCDDKKIHFYADERFPSFFLFLCCN